MSGENTISVELAWAAQEHGESSRIHIDAALALLAQVAEHAVQLRDNNEGMSWSGVEEAAEAILALVGHAKKEDGS